MICGCFHAANTELSSWGRDCMGQNLALYSKSLPSLEIDYQKVLTLERVENRKIEGENASLIWNADVLLSHRFWARGKGGADMLRTSCWDPESLSPLVGMK